MRDPEKVPLFITCPTCGAEPDHPCRAVGYDRAPHTARFRAASRPKQPTGLGTLPVPPPTPINRATQPPTDYDG